MTNHAGKLTPTQWVLITIAVVAYLATFATMIIRQQVLWNDTTSLREATAAIQQVLEQRTALFAQLEGSDARLSAEHQEMLRLMRQLAASQCRPQPTPGEPPS